jgi:pimeloyl-ACP methyl ester carboxylesterase
MTTSTVPELSHIVRGSGPGLLLAHGGTGSIEGNFGPLIDPLAERYTVVGPDYPGSGTTPRSATALTLDGLADRLVDTAVRAGVESFAILGYSMGTTIAIRAATRHPDRVTGLVLTAGFAYPNARMRLAVDTWRRLIESGDRRNFAGFMSLTGAGARWLDEQTQREVDDIVDGMAPGDGDLDQLDLIQRIDVRADLPAIRVPTLVIATTGDHLATPWHSRELAEGIPGARSAELDSGHLVWVENGAEWLTLITDFLATVEG